MFTVCPKCTLTLSVSAGDLRSGQGYVRCGRCQNVFNALLTLSEQPPEAMTPAPAPSQGEAPAAAAQGTARPAAPQTKAAGEASSIQIDQILMLGGESFPRAPGASADGPVAARGSAPSPASARASVPNPAAARAAAAAAAASTRAATPASKPAPTAAGPGALHERKRPQSEEVQIESEDITDQVELPRSSRDTTQRTAAPRASATSKPSPPAAAPVRSDPAASQHKKIVTSERAGETARLEDHDGANMESRSVETIVLEGEGFTQIQGYVSEEQAGLEALRREIESLGDDGTASAGAAPGQPGQATVSRGRYHQPSSGRGEAERSPRRGAAQSPGAPSQEAIAADDDVQAQADEAESVTDFPFNPFARAGTPYRWVWLSGALALGLLLCAQGIDHWRDALAASPGVGSWIKRAYAHAGVALEPHWDLNAYEVRQQGAASDPSDAQVIHVRLSLANHASRAQPVPLLRLTLLDRYGKHIARRDLTPTEYWPQGRAGATFLTADQRVDTEVAVRDPNAESASFELDVCLRAQQRIECAGDTAGATASALTH
jgi:predicted Zn finger-like uncharacterized protein